MWMINDQNASLLNGIERLEVFRGIFLFSIFVRDFLQTKLHWCGSITDMQSEFRIIAYLMGDDNVTLLLHALGCRIWRCSKSRLVLLETGATQNILMRFFVIVVGNCCFIQTRTSCSEIVPLITFPWESVQIFWGQFISREESKWEPKSSQSETRCFNGNNNNNKKHFREAFEKFGSFSTPEWKHIPRPQKPLWKCTADLWLPQPETLWPMRKGAGP